MQFIKYFKGTNIKAVGGLRLAIQVTPPQVVHRPDLDFSLNFQIGLPGGTAAGGLVLVDCRLFALN